ncbi:oxygenase MpaB family protein [Streptomyces sp. NPDC012756]|uniref:oxygenase MpaB family protein n=1 Tax=Streptomyces sp. NPDC012756 TaxID=3364847 RepID=UPI0036C67D32
MQNTPSFSDGTSPSPADATTAVMRGIAIRMAPPFGKAFFNNLVYTLGFLRVVGEVEGAAAVDRAGTGKIHRRGDNRADDTADQFQLWIRHGASSPESTAAIARVQRMHDHFSRTYAFSNETYVHGIALFTLLFDEIFGHVGIDAFSEAEKDAQVQHWRTIAEQMHVKDVPTTWAGMQQALRTYETSPDWYRRTPAGQ